MTAPEPGGGAAAVRGPADPTRALRPPIDPLRALHRPIGTRPAFPPPGAPHRPDALLRALLVVGVAASAALHAQMALAGTHGPGWSVLMGVMAVLCLSCLAGLVRAGDPTGTVRMTMGMALAMALGHVMLLPLLAGGSGAHGAHAHHGGSPTAEHAAGAGHGGMLLVVVVELAVAGVAVGWTRRHTRHVTYQTV